MRKKLLKLIKLGFRENCILCKQSAEGVVCNYCLSGLQKDINIQHQKLDFGLECDYYHLLNYSAEVRYLLQKLKFHKDLLVTQVFSKLIIYWWDQVCGKYFVDVDAIAVVPIHRYRYLYRGFNQAEVLAQKLAEYTDIATTFESYSRIKYTKSQAKSSKQKRAEQIKGVFHLDKPMKANHLLVFDDVLTTGSTMKEFIQTIVNDSNIEKISVVTLVRPN
ncbi:amidophosphoribosyltransferase [Candidatus Francisella endociliophora]|uniref:Amidophosphoribosyltransferase n=1 Tax=Candidatus Francisella endociliophora TaxID=653937 RepID=A0A097ERW9_9GAMM|nr:amidophosphoribosyltransferase [Francisella sp. FSC1006]